MWTGSVEMYKGYLGVPHVLSASSASASALSLGSWTISSMYCIFENLHGGHHFGILYLLHRWH